METSFPASFAQQRLWFIQKMSPLSTAYNLVFQMDLPSGVDPQTLRRALLALMARHETLRTNFEFNHGELKQVVQSEAEVPLHVCDLRNSPSGAEQFAQCVSSSVATPFDLSKAPLWRAHLGVFDLQHSRLAIIVHHAIADAQSAQILVEDLSHFYSRLMSNQAALLPELPIQYADFSVWQRQSMTGRRLDRVVTYWQNRLRGFSELALPLDYVRPPHVNGNGALHRFLLPATTVSGVRALAKNSGTTLFCTLMTAFTVAMARLTGQSAITIGTPVSGRPKPELERVVGLFVNSLVFHCRIEGNPTFQELLQQVNRDWAEDLTAQDLPFDLLLEALQAPRQTDRNPIFQVMFQLQTVQRQKNSEDRSASEPKAATSQLDLSIIQREILPSGEIEGAMVYSSDLFDQGTIRQISDLYQDIVESVAIDPGAPVWSLPQLSAPRRRVSFSVSEGETRAWQGEANLVEWFRTTAREHGAQTAVIGGVTEVTFAQLDSFSNSLAQVLKRSGVERGSIVAICAPRSVETIVAILSVLKAGGAYLYLDPGAAEKWRELVLSDSDARVMMGLHGAEHLALGRKFVPIDLATNGPDEPLVAAESQSPGDPAYVIYTSGSTGRPKGVVISHAAILNHMRWLVDQFSFGPGDRILQRTPLTFDASVWEVLAPLTAGAVMVLADDAKSFDPVTLLNFIVQQRITTLQVVPSLLRVLVRYSTLRDCVWLRYVFCGGEPLTAELRDQFHSKSTATLINLYGPTETTIDATFHVCDRSDRRAFVPIGKPVANASATILDDQRRLLPAGAAGELYIGGAAVGVGYLNQPNLTAERFVALETFGNQRFFRTGDRVRQLASGELQYLGRLDNQVKLRGFRIELQEIEKVLGAHPDVREAVAVVQQFASADERLVAFVSLAGNGAADISQRLRRWLSDRLPQYAVPSIISIENILPKTAHGKIDRALLARKKTQVVTRGLAPETELEHELCRAFEAVLKVSPVGRDDNFFQLGGHSLLVVALQEMVAAELDCELNIVDIFECPTPRELAPRLKRTTKDFSSAELTTALTMSTAGGIDVQ